MPFDLSSAHF